MAEAATIPNTTPKQLGRQLRAVRRRKGLSLSEVARGAGLSRRELVAYERGKVPIPESDLWVLAGSCGVDVSELAPERGRLELEAGPETIGDTIAFLRQGHQNGGGRAVLALEAAEPASFYSGPQAAAEPPAPPAVAAAPGPGVAEPTTAPPIDVFEELARLPEPVPLTNDPHDYPDMLAPPAFLTADARIDSLIAESAFFDSTPSESTMIESRQFESAMIESNTSESPTIESALTDSGIAPPAGTFELVDDQPFAVPPAASVADLLVPEHPGFEAPTVVDAAPDTVEREWTPADAPPIDVAHRGETFAPPAPTTDWQADTSPTWHTPDWEAATSGVWNEPDTAPATPEWSGDADSHAETAAWSPAEAFDPETSPDRFDARSDADRSVDDAAVEVIALTSYEHLRDLRPAQTAPPADHAQWAHEPDPEATSTGFLVDWGDPDAPVAPRSESRTRGALEPATETIDSVATDIAVELDDLNDQGDERTEAPPIPGEIVASEEGDALTPSSELPEEATVEPCASTATVEPCASTAPAESIAPVTPAASLEEPRPDEWVTAGDEWELGNALPLVEVRGQGALVMRRADERWALANLTVSDRYLVEVDVEFRAGPGFGVLFRADVDDDGRMSAFSFDLDPVYEGGGYLVRQWQADRELWNPIAHVAADDPGAMYGNLTVRLEVANERLVATVNDTIVMTVEDLREGSLERGRTAPTGQRVGVQAWSSSDLVIETLRIADR